MTSPLEPKKAAPSSSLMMRILSACVMIPVVLLAVYLGGGLFIGIVSALCVLMLFEWVRMIDKAGHAPLFYMLTILGIVALCFAGMGKYAYALWLVVVSGLGAYGLALANKKSPLWAALPAVYIILPCVALIWLRLEVPNGRALSFVLFFCVWAADSGAFFFGKFLGGPKINHALSPSKTWAGIAGGIVGGLLVSPITAYFFLEGASLSTFALIGACLGMVSVIGDLAESAIKRKFGLKDISGLIPGHGGVLDRLDGMIFATIAMTAAIFLYMM